MSKDIHVPAHPLKAVVGIIVFLAVAIWLLVKLATSGFEVDASVMTKEAVAARLKPVGESVASEAPPGQRSGEMVYKAVCINCHGSGLAGAPKFGDKGAWGSRIAKGFDTLIDHGLHGFNAMPAKGGSPDLSDDEVKRAIAYMANAAGANFAAPGAGAAASASAPASASASASAPAAGAAPAVASAGGVPDPNTVGKKIYDSVCVACHATGAAGAPKFGDKAAWAPRLAQGVDKLYDIAKKGINAMPPKGGYSGSDEEFHSAVIYLTNAAK
jgi:cytochrome c5